uniref:CYP6BH5 n=1 Tax=Phaedon cochleariae TaxID=80249 RepID=A0A5B9RHF9_PHACE|nr:CYP6BH5 [Phaedon cochleariae]
MLVEAAILLASLVLLATLFVKYKYGYWKRRNVPYLEPTFPIGNNTSFLPKGISIGIISNYFYNEFKKKGLKVGGVFLGMDPQLVLVDPEYVRTILIKDFNSFVDRGIYMTKNDPVTVTLFSQKGQDWKNSRNKFTSVFTSAKIKSMYDTLKECSTNMISTLDESAEKILDVDVLEIMARFTTDVVGSVIFGVECNCFKNPDAEFRRIGKHLFDEFTLMDLLNLFATIFFPNMAGLLGISNIQPDVSKYFSRIIRETVEYREKNNVVRKDFLDLLIQLKNSGQQITVEDIIGQSFIFFAAGFETSSTTITMTLFELAQNQEAQDRVREEVINCLEKDNNDPTYETIMEMKYLGLAVDETLRLWPPVTTLTRVCVQDYKYPGGDFSVEKGRTVIIPVLGLHRDPDYFPDPLKWNPDRFADKNQKSVAYFPFGDGPRNCIGMRFGLMQVKLGLAILLKNYKVFPSPATETPLEIDPDTFVIHTKQRVYLKFEKI